MRGLNRLTPARGPAKLIHMNAFSSTAARLASSAPACVEDGARERLGTETFPLARESERHLRVRAMLTRQFNRALSEAYLVIPCGFVRLAPDIEVRPDLHVHAGAKRSEDVRGGDIALAIEICQGTAMLDYERKVPHYARSGVRELWVLDLDTERVVMFRKPTPHGYFNCTEHPPTAPLTPEAFPGFTTSLAGLA